MLVTGIGALVALYARYYMSPADPVPRFFSFFLAFMGAMLGVVLSGNLIQLVVLLGADEPLLVPADRLLAPPRGRAARRAHGARRHRRRRAVPARRRAGARAHRRQLRPRRGARRGRARPRARALPGGARAGPAGRAHQERAVPVPLLAAARDGGADAGVGVPALGDDGEGRRVPARAAVAGARGHGGRGSGSSAAPGACTLLLGAYRRDVPERPEAPARLLDDQPPRPDHAAARPEQPARRGGGGVPHDEPRDVQGVAVHGGGHHRPRDRHARHPAPARARTARCRSPARWRWWRAPRWPACRC